MKDKVKRKPKVEPYLGDTVRILKDPKNRFQYRCVPTGLTGEVIGIDRGGLYVSWKRQDGSNTEDKFPRDMLTVKKKSTIRHPRLGDTVQILRSPNLTDIGLIGEITGQRWASFEVTVGADGRRICVQQSGAGGFLTILKSNDGYGETLAPIDPRIFYKILRIDGTPPNGDAHRTKFRYDLPTQEGKCLPHWTPIVPAEELSMCQQGYHILESGEAIGSWLSNYSEADCIVTECKARGRIIADGSGKLVAQSIIITRILYRWMDVQTIYNAKQKDIHTKYQLEMKALTNALLCRPAFSWDMEQSR